MSERREWRVRNKHGIWYPGYRQGKREMQRIYKRVCKLCPNCVTRLESRPVGEWEAEDEAD